MLLEKYPDLWILLAELFRDYKKKSYVEVARKGYIDIALGSAEECSRWTTQEQEFLDRKIYFHKTRPAQDRTMVINFADLPTTIPAEEVKAGLLAGLTSYGKVLDFHLGKRGYIPAGFFSRTAQATIAPYPAINENVDLIPRWAVLGENEEAFYVNPEFARPRLAARRLHHPRGNHRGSGKDHGQR
ncbi:hypothetical protein FRX31_012358 [Thalictrum thalictroides]|uniref:Uncharacterized protein n=1 Tax=Thalictrum thalictroides TaxID=46969 RepID=A0A7J6WM56_THATH|nr:hypothetical protein FRX31_012358 [Thalictrum thalictroides]